MRPRRQDDVPYSLLFHLLNRSDIPLQARELLPRQAFVLSASARVYLADHHAHGANPQKVPQLQLVRLRRTVPISSLRHE